jgi:ProQ/FINO family
MGMRNQYRHGLRQLAALYPMAFFRNPLRVKPLTNVKSELLERHADELGVRTITLTLEAYTSSRSYFEAVTRGGKKINLYGSSVEDITPEEQREASQWLEDRTITRCCEEAQNEAIPISKRREVWRILDKDHFEIGIKASAAGNSANQTEALRLRREVLTIAEALARADPSETRHRDLLYAKYFERASACIVAELEANFLLAREAANAALECAKHLRADPNFFPNIFFDEIDLATHGSYIDAVEYFKGGQFDRASESFEQWLVLNRSRADAWDPTYDCNQFNRELSAALASAQKGTVDRSQWEKLENIVASEELNLHRTARALWDHVEPIKAHCLSTAEGTENNKFIRELLIHTPNDWPLLSTHTVLTAWDRLAALEETVRLPRCLDILSGLPTADDLWPFLLVQNLRNALMLKADYHTKLERIAGRTTTKMLKGSFEIERLEDRELIDYTRSVMRPSKTSIFDKSMNHWSEAKRLISTGQRRAAVQNTNEFFAILRSFPHVVRIKSVEEVGGPIGQKTSGKFNLRLERIWSHPRNELLLEGSRESLIQGAYAYMRPRWNTYLAPRHLCKSTKDVRLIATRVPEWQLVFQQWALGSGHVPAPDFLGWCNQIERGWLPVAMRLLSNLVYFSVQDVRETLRQLYRTTLPANAKGERTVFVGLGGAHKSGPHLLFSLQQAIKDLPSSERSFDIAKAFRTIDSFQPEEIGFDCIVFIDDFIGTGQQSVGFLNEIFSRYPRFGDRTVYVLSLAGLQEGINQLQAEFTDLRGKIIVARKFRNIDKAFSEQNPLWDSEKDRLEAQHWCEDIGKQLICERDALGYKGSEALVAFYFNTPNNTLPLFWASGKVNSNTWIPLLKRF